MSSQEQRVDISVDYVELSSCNVHVSNLSHWKNAYEGSSELCLPRIHIETVDGLVSLGVISEWEELEGPSFLSMAQELCRWLSFSADTALDIFRKSSPMTALAIPERIELSMALDEVLAESDTIPQLVDFEHDLRRLQELVPRLAIIGGDTDGVDTATERSLALLHKLGEMLKYTRTLLNTQLLLNTVESEKGFVDVVILDRLCTEIPLTVEALERIELLYSEFTKETAGNVYAVIDGWGFRHCYAQEQAARTVADPIMDSSETLKVGNEALRGKLIEFNQAIFSKLFECTPMIEKTIDLSTRDAYRIRDAVVFNLGDNLGESFMYKIGEDVIKILEDVASAQSVVFNTQQGRFILSALSAYYEDLEASVSYDPTQSTSSKMAEMTKLIDKFHGVFGNAHS